MNGTIRNHHPAFDIEMLNDALDYHREHGTLDSDLAHKLQARLDEKLALANTPVANHVPTDGEPERRELDKRPQAGARAANQFGDFAVKVASPAQIAFIRRLMAERDVSKTPWRLPEINDRLSKKVASSVIDILTACPVLAEKKAEVAAAALATEKQIAAIRREGDRRVYRADGPTSATVDAVRAGQPILRADASAALDVLFGAPFKPRETTAAATLDIGIYQAGQTIYKVYPNQARSRMLAKLLILPQGWMEMTHKEREASAEQPAWDYQGIADRFVKREQKLTLEQAQQFGQITSICCNCGALLTEETSIARGLGPWCAAKFA